MSDFITAFARQQLRDMEQLQHDLGCGRRTRRRKPERYGRTTAVRHVFGGGVRALRASFELLRRRPPALDTLPADHLAVRRQPS